MMHFGVMVYRPKKICIDQKNSVCEVLAVETVSAQTQTAIKDFIALAIGALISLPSGSA